jgi:hypothetical protein
LYFGVSNLPPAVVGNDVNFTLLATAATPDGGTTIIFNLGGGNQPYLLLGANATYYLGVYSQTGGPFNISAFDFGVPSGEFLIGIINES